VAKGDGEEEEKEQEKKRSVCPSFDGRNRNASFMYFLFAKSQEPSTLLSAPCPLPSAILS